MRFWFIVILKVILIILGLAQIIDPALLDYAMIDLSISTGQHFYSLVRKWLQIKK